MKFKHYLKKVLPKHHEIVKNKHLKIFGTLLHDPNIWHINRRSIARAFAVGLFFAWIPVPFQMLLAAGAAIIFHANLALSIALVWITNPVTMPFLFYIAYRVGVFVLNKPIKDFSFELTIQWLASTIKGVGGPFLLGCLILAVISAFVGYYLSLTIWRWHVISNWRKRKAKQQSSI